MRLSVILRYGGFILLINSVFMLLAMIISLCSEGDSAYFAFFLSFFISVTVGAFPLIFIPHDSYINIREVYGILIVSWATVCLFGVLPYIMWGGEFSIINAWFESVSGYTTTGATILNSPEDLPNSILFFRSCTQWMGGVGVVLFAMLLAPAMRMNKTRLSQAEISTLAKENFIYKTQEIITIILSVYLGATLLCFLLCKAAGMNWFEAINHAFSTVSTGGFSTKNTSIAAFDSTWIYIITIIFMLTSSIHFGLLYSAVSGNAGKLFKSPVIRYFFLSVMAGIFSVSVNLWLTDRFDSFWDSLLHGAFQVVSYTTTTGYASFDSSILPSFSIIVIVFFALQSGCAGSTNGGIKVDRIYIFFQTLKVQIRKQQHPKAIIPVKVGKNAVDEDIVNSVLLFILLFLFIQFIATVILTAMGYDLLSAFSAVLASLTNVGAGFGDFSSLGNYDSLASFGKILMTVLMITGRLEIYGLILFFYIRK
ncbi:MAG: TrkH family potassium uptake protein [Prevotellaceae bacterium]|nr:TrkH family potassium uptake protein [Prevotellaceae bacterium]